MSDQLNEMPDSALTSKADDLFYPGFAVLIAGTAFFGFYFTYFFPMLSGDYPEVSPFVHLHGWSFFIWYILFPIQALLISVSNGQLHKILGRTSIVLALIMILTGVFVLSVRMEEALLGGDNPFMSFLRQVGGLIFSNLLLFTVFYGAAIRMALTGNFEAHKRLIVLASCAGLGAALFRIFGFLFGPVEWANTGWVLAINAFMIVAMIYDRIVHGRIHKVYWIGLALSLVIEAMLWPFQGNVILSTLNALLGELGSLVSVFY